MNLLLETSLNIQGTTYPLYIYEDTHYKDSLTGESYEDLVFLVDYRDDQSLLVSANSITEEVLDGYKQNSVISPQDCPICLDKFEFGHQCLLYGISSEEVNDSFPSTDDDDVDRSNMTQPAKNMSNAIANSIQSNDPLIHSIFPTKTQLVCKECLSDLLAELEDIRSDPDLLAKRL